MTDHDLALDTPQETKKRSILELRELGKELWKNMDGQKNVDCLRKEWDDRL